ncbi:MAG TPA: type II toxin-antitoxin system VapC family toxin [Verrucomicrobiae bacterium]|nr:type II toxin-antitoxin system VapC family toxin [Verrucomicrobiae bacterium]
MKFIVDANVLSELTRPAPNPRVLDWLRDNEADLAVTPIVLGEIEYGILLLAQGRQRRLLQQWFADRVRTLVVLDFDAQTAHSWAELLARLKQHATPMPIKDSLIAASALQHTLSVATRNTADFQKARVPIVNPFTD